MADGDSLEIGFTQVLYGVVIASAIFKIQFALVIRNFMILLTLAFILGDWIEYQIGIQDASGTTVNYVTAFVLDVVILIIWYLMTIIPAADLDWFFVMAAVFFFLQAVWDKLILGFDVATLIKKPHLQLMPFFFVLAGIERFFNLPLWLLLAMAAIVFFARKSLRWQTLLVKSPEAL